MLFGATTDLAKQNDPALAQAEIVRAKAGRGQRRPADPGLAAGPDGADGDRPRRTAERRLRGQRQPDDRCPRHLASRQPDDTADRRTADAVRDVHGLRRARRPVCEALHDRQRAEPEPLLAAAVRPRRGERRGAGIPPPPDRRLRRAESGRRRSAGARRRALAARQRQPGAFAPHALADEVHQGHGHRLPGERAHQAGHGRALDQPVRGQLERLPGRRPPPHDLDRYRGLRQAREAPRRGFRRHRAAGIDAADLLRGVRRRVAPRPRRSARSTAARSRRRRSR